MMHYVKQAALVAVVVAVIFRVAPIRAAVTGQ